jgi:hypothetical protein
MGYRRRAAEQVWYAGGLGADPTGDRRHRRREGIYHLHPREAVIPLDSPRGRDLAGGGGDIIFQPGAIVVQGTVVTERDLVDAVHTGLLRKKNEGQRLNLS